MPPLPETVSILLRSSPTSAMAALLLISTSHRGLLDWFSRSTVCSDAPESEPHSKRQKPNGAARRGRSHRKPRDNGDDPYLNRRREARDRSDEALLASMRSNPDGAIGDWATTIGKSRTSTVSALHRLRDAGLANQLRASGNRPRSPRRASPQRNGLRR